MISKGDTILNQTLRTAGLVKSVEPLVVEDADGNEATWDPSDCLLLMAAKNLPMISWEHAVAGDAIFTVEVPPEVAEKQGWSPHYTYRVQRVEFNDKAMHFVKVLSGPNNTADYTYMGRLDTIRGSLELTAKSRVSKDTPSFLIAARVLKALFEKREEAIKSAGWAVHHVGRCCRCARVLTTPESIEAGIGPVCAGRM